MSLRLNYFFVALLCCLSTVSAQLSIRHDRPPDQRIHLLRERIGRARELDARLTQLLSDSPIRSAVLRTATGAPSNRALWERSTDVSVATLEGTLDEAQAVLQRASSTTQNPLNRNATQVATRLALSEMLATELERSLQQRFDILTHELRAAGYLLVGTGVATLATGSVIAAPAAVATTVTAASATAAEFAGPLFGSAAVQGGLGFTLSRLADRRQSTTTSQTQPSAQPERSAPQQRPSSLATHRPAPTFNPPSHHPRQSPAWRAYRRALSRLRALEQRVREATRRDMETSPLLEEAIARLVRELPRWQSSQRPPAGLGDLQGLLTQLQIAFGAERSASIWHEINSMIARADAAMADALPPNASSRDVERFSTAQREALRRDWGERISEWTRVLREQHLEQSIPNLLGIACAHGSTTHSECLGWLTLLKVENLHHALPSRSPDATVSPAETSAITQALGFEEGADHSLSRALWFQDPSGRRWDLSSNRLISETQAEAWTPLLNSAELGWRLLERLQALSSRMPVIATALATAEARALLAQQEALRQPIIPLWPERLPPPVAARIATPAHGSVDISAQQATPAALRPADAEWDDTLPMREPRVVFQEIARVLQEWVRTDVAPENLFELILEADRFFMRENPPSQTEWPYLVGRWRALARRARASIQGLGESSSASRSTSGHETDQIQAIRNFGVDAIIKNYFRDSGSVIRALRGQGTNCQGNTALLLGMLASAHVKPARGERYVLNHYIDHVEVGVLNDAHSEIWVPMSNELQQGAVGWVYRAPMLLWSVLERGISSGYFEQNPVELSTLAIAEPRRGSAGFSQQGHGIVDFLRMAWESGFRIPESTYGLPLSLGMLFRGLTGKPSYIPQRADMAGSISRSAAHQVPGDRRALSNRTSGTAGGGSEGSNRSDGSGSGRGNGNGSDSAPTPRRPFSHTQAEMEDIRRVPTNLFELTRDLLREMRSDQVTTPQDAEFLEPRLRTTFRRLLALLGEAQVLSPPNTQFNVTAQEDPFQALRTETLGVTPNTPLDQSCARFAYQVVQARVRRANRENECHLQLGTDNSPSSCRHLDLLYLAESVRVDAKWIETVMVTPETRTYLNQLTWREFWKLARFWRTTCGLGWVGPAIRGEGIYGTGSDRHLRRAGTQYVFSGLAGYTYHVGQPSIDGSFISEEEIFGGTVSIRDTYIHSVLFRPGFLEELHHLPAVLIGDTPNHVTTITPLLDLNSRYCLAPLPFQGSEVGRKPLFTRLMEGEATIPNRDSAGRYRIVFPENAWTQPRVGRQGVDYPLADAGLPGYCELVAARGLLQRRLVTLRNHATTFPADLSAIAALSTHLLQGVPRNTQGEPIAAEAGLDRPWSALPFAPGITRDLGRTWENFKEAHLLPPLTVRPYEYVNDYQAVGLDHRFDDRMSITNPGNDGAGYPAFVQRFWDEIYRIARPVVVPALMGSADSMPASAHQLLGCDPLVGRISNALVNTVAVQNYERSFTPEGLFLRRETQFEDTTIQAPLMHLTRIAEHVTNCNRIRQRLIDDALSSTSGRFQNEDAWIVALRRPRLPEGAQLVLDQTPPTQNGVAHLMTEMTTGRIGILRPPRDESIPTPEATNIAANTAENTATVAIDPTEPLPDATYEHYDGPRVPTHFGPANPNPTPRRLAPDVTRVSLPPVEYARVILRLLQFADTSPENRATLLARLLDPAIRLPRTIDLETQRRFREFRALALLTHRVQTTATGARLVRQARARYLRSSHGPVVVSIPRRWIAADQQAAWMHRFLGPDGVICDTSPTPDPQSAEVTMSCR